MGKRGHPCSASTSRKAAKASAGPDRARTVKLEHAESPLVEPALTSDSLTAPTLQMGTMDTMHTMGTMDTHAALAGDADAGTALGLRLVEAEEPPPDAEARCTVGALGV